MYVYMGAADVVVSRASGNTMAELGVQGKPTIAIPSPYLADGHQLRNADYLAEQGMALVVHESELPDGLSPGIQLFAYRSSKGKGISTKITTVYSVTCGF